MLQMQSISDHTLVAIACEQIIGAPIVAVTCFLHEKNLKKKYIYIVFYGSDKENKSIL